LLPSALIWVNFVTVPFDEDGKESEVWFLDHDYLENMYGMFKKVNGMCDDLLYFRTVTFYHYTVFESFLNNSTLLLNITDGVSVLNLVINLKMKGWSSSDGYLEQLYAAL